MASAAEAFGAGLSALAAPALLSYLLTYFVHSTLAVGLALLCTKTWRSCPDALREAAWTLALFAPPLTAALHAQESWPTLGPIVHLGASAPATAPAAFDASDAFEALGASDGADVGPAAVLPADVDVDLVGPSLAGGASTPARLTAEPSAEAAPSFAIDGDDSPAASTSRDVSASGAWPRSSAILPLAVGAWTLGALIALALLARGVWRFARSERRPLDGGALRARLDVLAARARLGRVRLFVDPRTPVPVAFGVLRPSIALPPRALRELEPLQQDAMLAHELAHLARRDPLRLFLCRLIEAAFFFQPLNRHARRALFDVAEFRCDARASLWLGDGLQLAACLAQVAGWLKPERAPAWRLEPLAMARHGSPLARRVGRLLEERGSRQELRAAEVLVLVLALGSFAAAAPAFRPEAPRLPSASSAPPELDDVTTIFTEEVEDEVAPESSASVAVTDARETTEALARLLARLDAQVASLRAEVLALEQDVRLDARAIALAPELARVRSRLETIDHVRSRLGGALEIRGGGAGPARDAAPLSGSGPRSEEP